MLSIASPLLAVAAVALGSQSPPSPSGTTPAGEAAAPPPPALDGLRSCEDSLDVAIFNSPRRVSTRGELRVLIVSEREIPDAQVAALDPHGRLHRLDAIRTAGPPWGWVARIPRPARGTWLVGLGVGDRVDACQRVRVRKRGGARDRVDEPLEQIWRSRIKWERDTENLYSLWIERLFDAPLDADVSWRPLHQVLRDPERNLLFNHLGLGEDDGGRDALRIKPDCADFPYTLRAYFAWKLGLPFAFRRCTRGNAKRAPRCSDKLMTNQMAPDPAHPEVALSRKAAFSWFLRRKVMGTVHSSTLRTLPESEESDFYPVALNRHGVRPGTVYADPYGHTLMVGRWFPQVGDTPGVLLAIDAQPDGTIGRRRFWKGSFLFPEDDAVRGAGFKRFRAVKRRRDGTLYELSNAQLARSRDYGDVSLEQWEHGKEAFYERMDALITPRPIPPEAAIRATLDALEQQVRRRVESVDNAERWKREHPGAVMAMPEGGAIFLTSGPWEDYSTPSRDMRLLIAIDTAREQPQRVERHPERFRLPPGVSPKEVRARMEELLRREAAKRTITYRRSDGSPWTLSLADVMDRAVALESAYDPNDCVEYRWGAAPGTDEYAPCQRRAPAEQRERMERYRPWFRRRMRPLY